MDDRRPNDDTMRHNHESCCRWLEWTFAFILVCSIGLVSNAVLLTILFKYEKGWSLGKTMLVLLHVTEVVSLFIQLPPFIAVIATAPRVPGSNPTVYLPGWNLECAVSASVGSFVVTLEPYILAMLAYVRWSVVKSSKEFNQKRKQPPVRKMIAGLLTIILINTIIGEAISGGVYAWLDINLCLGRTNSYSALVLLFSFLACAPYIITRYFKVIRALRESEDNGGGSAKQNQKRREAIRLLIVLTGSYYLSHSPFFFRLIAETVTGGDVTSLLVARLTVTLYFTYPMMSPILSIMLTERYRMYAMRMFCMRPDGTTLSGSKDIDSSQSDGSTTMGGVNRHKKLSVTSSSSGSPPSVFRSSIASTSSWDYSPEKPRLSLPRDSGFRNAGFATPRDSGFRNAGFSTPRDSGFRNAGFATPRDSGFRTPRESGFRNAPFTNPSSPSSAGFTAPSNAGLSVPSNGGFTVPNNGGFSVPSNDGFSVPSSGGTSATTSSIPSNSAEAAVADFSLPSNTVGFAGGSSPPSRQRIERVFSAPAIHHADDDGEVGFSVPPPRKAAKLTGGFAPPQPPRFVPQPPPPREAAAAERPSSPPRHVRGSMPLPPQPSRTSLQRNSFPRNI